MKYHHPKDIAARRIQQAQRYNRTEKQPQYEISLSIGYSTKESNGQSIEEIEKIVDGHLKHHKLLDQRCSHHAIISSA
ncbi:MAG TPA: hypothetical protein DEF04_07840, partial [Clostridiales bacterium]|nr:hypothetical protein [Clostridiales bacterium]